MASIEEFPEGSFGFIIKAIGDPVEGEKDTNVMKIFKDKGDLETLLKITKTLNNIMGKNNGHRMKRYNLPYKNILVKNPKAAEHYEKIITNKYKNKLNANDFAKLLTRIHTANVPVLRMPDNGIDIYEMARTNKTYTCNTNLLLLQIEKLLLQTKTLYESEWIHCDIRDANVMIKFDNSGDNDTIDILNPRLTIIDFDFLMKFNEYAPTLENLTIFTSYNKPPECILFKYGYDPPIKMSEHMQTLRDYTLDIFMKYTKVWAYRLNISMPNTRPAISEYRKLCLKHYTEAETANKNTMKPDTMKPEPYTFNKNTLPYIDNFGLGFALLQLIHTIYKEIPDGPLKQTVELLTSISDLHIEKRTNPVDAYNTMKRICDPIRNNVSSGGRRTRRTRRTRHKRNRRTYKN